MEADQTVVTPKSAVAKELVNMGYALVSKYGDQYKVEDKAEDLKWIDDNGDQQETATLVGDQIPDTVTYLVQPITYTITYQNASGSPAAAESELNALTAAAGTPAADADGKNPTRYTRKDTFTAKNPDRVYENSKWYQCSHWTLGDNTSDNTAGGLVGTKEYENLVVEQGTVGNLTFIANWGAVSDLGNLTVQKTVEGNAGDKRKDFHFTVTLSDTSISGTFGDMEFIDGKAAFTLKDGESKTAAGLLAGMTYTVTETESNRDGYVTGTSGATGMIAKDTPATASFTNTKNVGSLIVSNTVAGDFGDKNKKFHFTVSLTDAGGSRVNGTFGGVTFADGAAEFELRDDQSRELTGIPSGTKYKVMGEEAPGYTVAGTGSEGTIDAGTKTAAFTNIYTLQPVEADSAELGINGTKTLEGREFREGDEFRFVVRNSENAPEGQPLPTSAECVVNPESGNSTDIKFGRFTFVKPGTYLYMISEYLPQNDGADIIPGVTYDTAAYRLTVNVEDNKAGALVISNIRLERSDRIEVGQWTQLYYGKVLPLHAYCKFTNIYSAKEQTVALTGTKHLENKKLSDYGNRQFMFIVEAVGKKEADGSFVKDPMQPMPVGSKEGFFIHSNLQTGGIVLPGNTFTQEHIGAEYRYTITEYQPTTTGRYDGTGLDGAVKNADGKWVYKGVTYDDHVHTVDVAVNTVTNENNEDEIKVAVNHDTHGSGAMENFIFTNSYNASVSIPLTGTKKLAGRNFVQSDRFTFHITPEDGAPAPVDDDGKTVTQVVVEPADGNATGIDFGTLHFNVGHMNFETEKIFTYKLTEAEGTAAYMAYDTAERVIRVKVKDDGCGNMTAELVSQLDELVWINVYAPEVTETPTPTPEANMSVGDGEKPNTPAEPGKPDQPDSEKPTGQAEQVSAIENPPKTGDETNPNIWFAIMGFPAACLIAVLVMIEQRNKRAKHRK